MRVHELVSRQEQAEENLSNVMEQKMRMHKLKRERINLNMEAKMINVERQKRVAEYGGNWSWRGLYHWRI